MSCTSLRPSRTIRGTLRGHQRSGFTLVELLVVMAILGVLAGLLAWGVNSARVAILKRAQAAEIANIATAVEAYRTKYGDYPPDGSSWPIMEAHLRKAFPNIVVSELALLNPAFPITADQRDLVGAQIHNDNSDMIRVFDPAEALVFFLGGFSSDSQRPFTGPGGPIREVRLNGKTIHVYNTQRENAFFEFNLSRLTLTDTPNGAVSNDEALFDQRDPNDVQMAKDLMPVYVGNGPTIAQQGRPIVYFDSRTYMYDFDANNARSNIYVPGSFRLNPNCSRPYLSDEVISEYVLAPPERKKPQRFVNSKTYQLIAPGYNRLYGGQPEASRRSNGLKLFAAFSGNAYSVRANSILFFDQTQIPAAYMFPEFVNEFRAERPNEDNCANFATGPTLGESQ